MAGTIFRAKQSGDGACFYFEVDHQTFKDIVDEEAYRLERIDRDMDGMKDDQPWRLYPGELLAALGFGLDKLEAEMEISIEVKEAT